MIDESIEQGSSGKGKQVVEYNDYDEYIKLKNANEKLMKDLEEIKSHNTIVLETLDHDEELILENEKLKEENKRLKEEKNNDVLKEENKKLKMEKEHLKVGLSKFARGKHLQSELLMNTDKKATLLMSAKLHHHNPCPSMLDPLPSMLTTCLERILVER